MYLFTLISGKTVHLKSGKKTIPKKDFSTVKSAEEIVSIAEEEAEEYKKELHEEAAALKEKSSQEGFEEGLGKFNKQLTHLDTLAAGIKDEMKEQILPILLSSLKKIVGEELKIAPDRIVDIVMQALKPVIQHHHITIYVNKDDLKKLEAKKKKLKGILLQIEVFSLQAREDIQPGGCIIETEAGIINAQLDNQIRALETALKTLMVKKKK
jgi:type III secretion protein L